MTQGSSQLLNDTYIHSIILSAIHKLSLLSRCTQFGLLLRIYVTVCEFKELYRTANLQSCILYIYSTNISTEYFKHGIYSPFFPLQNAVCFIILSYLVPVLFTFCIQDVLKLKKNNSGVFLVLSHSVYKMWIIQEPNTIKLWHKMHFEEENTESIHHV